MLYSRGGARLARSVVALGILVLLLAPLAPQVVGAEAFEKDTHFYLTYFIAVATCFEPIEALYIASGNLSVDLDGDVYPIPTFQDAKKAVMAQNPKELSRYQDALERNHAMGDKAKVKRILSAMKGNALDLVRKAGPTQLSLATFGVYLHAYQDSFSHEGYNKIVGHSHDSIVRGRDPDSLATNPAKSKDMAFGTLEIMLEACNILKRQPWYLTVPKDGKLDQIMDRLIAVSDPSWKKVTLKSTAEGLKDYISSKLFGGKTESRVEKVFKKELAILDTELGKIRAAGLPAPISIPRSGLSIDIDPGGLVSVKPGSSSEVEVKGSGDPADVSLGPGSTFIYMEGSTLYLELTLLVSNVGDAPSSEGIGVYAMLMDFQENLLAISILEGEPLAFNEERTYSITLRADLDGVEFSDSAPIMLLAAAYGGGEDPDAANNSIVAFITPGLLSSLAQEQGPGGTVTYTETVTETRMETVTTATDKTRTVDGGATGPGTVTQTVREVATETVTEGPGGTAYSTTTLTVTERYVEIAGFKIDLLTLLAIIGAVFLVAAIARSILK